MSRPIDADALMRAMYHRAFETDGDTMWQSGCWVRYRAIEQTVKEQPTIEPERKKGKWKFEKMKHIINGEVRDVIICSECDGGWFRYDISDNTVQNIPNFCPNCGADMRGGQE